MARYAPDFLDELTDVEAALVTQREEGRVVWEPQSDDTIDDTNKCVEIFVVLICIFELIMFICFVFLLENRSVDMWWSYMDG